MIKEFKFLSNKKSTGTNTIPHPDDLVCPLMREVYKAGYLCAMVGNQISDNRYANTQYAYMWNRGWIDYLMQNVNERV